MICEARTVVNVCVVPDVETLADNTTLATTNGGLDRQRKLDRANVRNAALEQRARRSTPDRRRVDGESLDVSSSASIDDGLRGRVVGKTVVSRDEVRVGVLGDLARGCSAVRAEVGPDTGTGGVDVDGSLAGGLKALLRAGEESGGGGQVEDVGDLEDDVELGGLLGQEVGVLERADDGLDTSDLGDLLRLLLRADESGDVVLRVLGDGLEDRGTDETCALISKVIAAAEDMSTYRWHQQ